MFENWDSLNIFDLINICNPRNVLNKFCKSFVLLNTATGKNSKSPNCKFYNFIATMGFLAENFMIRNFCGIGFPVLG